MGHRDTLNLKLYVIIDPQACAGRPPEDIAVAAAKGGATIMQYRDKCGDVATVRASAKRTLLAVRAAGFDIPFLVNDYVQVAKDIGADGVHIGQGDVSPKTARGIIGDDVIIGLTAFTPDHLAAVDPAIVDYVGTGPVYPTTTDKGKPVLGVDGLHPLVALSPVPMVAIGGITASRASDVLSAGVDGLAVMSGISLAADPAITAREFMDQYDL